MSILKLELENFKKFGSLELDLSKPLTLIYGENSSGKTSALRAILGLMQTFSRHNKYHAWNTHGEYVDLGFYKDYVKDHNIKNRFSISITTDKYELLHIKPKKTQITTKKYTYEYDSNSNQAKLYSYQETVDPKPFEESIKSLHENYNLVYSNSEIELISLIRPKTRSYFHMNIHPVCYLNMFGDGVKYNEKLKRLIDSEPQKVLFVDRFLIEPHNKKPSENFENLTYVQYFTFHRSTDSTDKLMATLYYLGPLRMTPSRSYKVSNTPADVGINGEHTPHVLAHLLNLHNKAKANKKTSQTKYENFTAWFKLVFPKNSVDTESYEDIVRLKVSTDGRADSISDVGFGFSQVLPIIVQAAAMDPGETLIIEQPELHLHPKAQVAFATFMTAAMKTGIKFVIETHSEHILKGLQLQISSTSAREAQNISDNDSISLTHDKVKIYYFNRDDSTKEMKLNKWGEIEGGWPDGFFDESYNISSQIVKNKMKATFLSKEKRESKEAL
ncbi:recombination protein F [compost metagenome]